MIQTRIQGQGMVVFDWSLASGECRVCWLHTITLKSKITIDFKDLMLISCINKHELQM